MVAPVKTTTWGGLHGSLTLVLDNADYALVTKNIGSGAGGGGGGGNRHRNQGTKTMCPNCNKLVVHTVAD
jgi:hypothetical protein